MSRLLRKFWPLLLAGLFGAAFAQNANGPKPRNSAAIKKPDGATKAKDPHPKTNEPVPIPEMTPEEIPPSAPNVTYRDGKLSVDSDNSTLADVLDALCAKIGAQLDKPAGADKERVALHLSGTPRQVISALLNDGKFGYIILSPLQDSDDVQKLVLTEPGDTRAAAVMQATARPAPVTPPIPVVPPTAQAEMQQPAVRQITPAVNPVPNNTADNQVAQSANVDAPEMKPADVQSVQNADVNPRQPEKTATQILQDLYRTRLQMQRDSQAQQQQ